MSATVTPAVERVAFPAGGLRLYRHQQETWDARRVHGFRRRIANDHRQSGKDQVGGVDLVDQAIHDPGVYAYIAPTRQMAENILWHGIRASDGGAYLSIIPPQLLLDRNEADLSLTVATVQPGKASRIICLSGNEPARVRGLPLKGVVITEYAQFEGPEILDTILPALNRSGGDLLVLSTPLGLNHYYQLWQMAQASPEWWTATRTIDDTVDHEGRPLIDPATIARELAQGQRAEWLDQEYRCRFTAALIGSYFGDLLGRMESEERITELAVRADRPVTVALDLGISDATSVVYIQRVGDWLHAIDYDEFTGLGLTEILPRIQSKGYPITAWLAPHDIAVREFTTGTSRLEAARRLGVRMTMVPRPATKDEAIDATRRLLVRLKVDRRRGARLLEALAAYERQWDPKGKTFKDRPLHNWASHAVDALGTFALGWRDRDEDGPRGPYQAKGGTTTGHMLPSRRPHPSPAGHLPEGGRLLRFPHP